MCLTTRHDRGSRTLYAVIRLNCSNDPTVTNYSCRINAIWSAVRGGAANPARPTYFSLDEFQDFLNLPVDAESLLVQARSFGLAMMLAYQHLDQLPDSIRSAVLANARSKVVFQTTFNDARVFAREFGRAVSDEDFMNLAQYEVLCRLATGEGVSAPVSGVTLPPGEPTGRAGEARTRSRTRYGRARPRTSLRTLLGAAHRVRHRSPGSGRSWAVPRGTREEPITQTGYDGYCTCAPSLEAKEMVREEGGDDSNAEGNNSPNQPVTLACAPAWPQG